MCTQTWFSDRTISNMASIDTPGLTILRQAHLDLEGLVMDSKVRSIRDRLSQDWSAAIYNGQSSPSTVTPCRRIKHPDSSTRHVL